MQNSEHKKKIHHKSLTDHVLDTYELQKIRLFLFFGGRLPGIEPRGT